MSFLNAFIILHLCISYLLLHNKLPQDSGLKHFSFYRLKVKVAVVSDSAILHVSSLSLLQGIFPTQGSNPGLPKLQVDSLPVESPGKPKNTKVGNLSLLQGIFQTQQSNWGLLQCRWILYQLSY